MAWRNTTHDWARLADRPHLAEVRRRGRELAPCGVLHLVLEVVAYASDEADERGSGRCRVTVHRDGSVTVADDGRGTDTRFRADGSPVRKPVMSTPDLRFYAADDPPSLPDGHPRRGLSVVAGLSEWLVHLNRRDDGAWSQRYQHGVPDTGLDPVDPDGTTGTTIRFLPDPAVRPTLGEVTGDLAVLTRWPRLALEVADER